MAVYTGNVPRFLDLALECCEDKGDNRPTMNEVVKVLEALAQHNKAKAKVSALATDETWLQDVYGDDIGSSDITVMGCLPSFLVEVTCHRALNPSDPAAFQIANFDHLWEIIAAWFPACHNIRTSYKKAYNTGSVYRSFLIDAMI